MERILRTVLIVTAALAAACAPRERTLVLLSTNDMHAKIQHFPRLAAAVEAGPAATRRSWWCWSTPATAGRETPT